MKFVIVVTKPEKLIIRQADGANVQREPNPCFCFDCRCSSQHLPLEVVIIARAGYSNPAAPSPQVQAVFGILYLYICPYGPQLTRKAMYCDRSVATPKTEYPQCLQLFMMVCNCSPRSAIVRSDLQLFVAICNCS